MDPMWKIQSNSSIFQLLFCMLMVIDPNDVQLLGALVNAWLVQCEKAGSHQCGEHRLCERSCKLGLYPIPVHCSQSTLLGTA